MGYLILEGNSVWDTTYVGPPDMVEWRVTSRKKLVNAKEIVRKWARDNNASICEKGWRAEKEYNEHPERFLEENINEVTREWCRIMKV